MTATLARPAGLDVLTGAPWLARRRPFRHWVATDVFRPVFVDDLTEQVRRLRARGLSEIAAADRFCRMGGFDTYAYPLTDPAVEGPLGLFVSRAWHDMLAELAGLPATGHVRAGLHHHLPGSSGGTVHNDFNPGYFERAADAGEIVLPTPRCSYHHGRAGRGDETVATVRALAVLYYFDNAGWSSSEGGQTALFHHAKGEPVLLVPPRDNTLLVFECTPSSFHAFRANVARPRNSLIMWLHRPWSDAVAHWGEKAIVPW